MTRTAGTSSPTAGSGPRIIAHRGDSGAAPENTLAAFRAAVAAGAEGVELDVQASRDGVPVVIHDERLERTTNGSGWVRDAAAAELGALEAGAWFQPPVAGQGVPTLRAVLQLLAPTGLEVHLELKTARHPYPGLVLAVLREVESTGMAGRVVFSSFNHDTLRETLRIAPQVPCAALLSEVLIEPWRYALEHGFSALHPHHATVGEGLVRACHAAGIAVRAYTVDDAAEAKRLIALGVDGIITNQPARLLAVRDAPGPA